MVPVVLACLACIKDGNVLCFILFDRMSPASLKNTADQAYGGKPEFANKVITIIGIHTAGT